jgi:hypothetical protein
VAALVLMIDTGVALFFIGAVEDCPHLLSFSAASTGPAKRNAERPAFVFKRRDLLSADELSRQLLTAPELDLDAEAGTSARLGAAARREDGPFTHPVCEPLLRRADLQGLPIAMGADCRLGEAPAMNLQSLSRELRQHLSQCARLTSSDIRVVLRQQLLHESIDRWQREEALPTLVQMLQPEERPLRSLLVELLANTKGHAASFALARRALFDLDAGVRETAVRALRERPRDEYRPLLLDGLRYPWAPVADHAAEALVALNDRAALLPLLELLGAPDAARPAPRAFRGIDPSLLWTVPRPREVTAVALDERQAGERRTRLMSRPDDLPRSVKASAREIYAVREVVCVNHLRNCLLCHAPSTEKTDPVRGLVPDPDRPLPPSFSAQYYGGPSGMFVRADVTYIRQDFSVPQPVAQPGKWPAYQRYDYLVRTRYPTEEELARKQPATYPQREAVRWALREMGAAAGD